MCTACLMGTPSRIGRCTLSCDRRPEGFNGSSQDVTVIEYVYLEMEQQLERLPGKPEFPVATDGQVFDTSRQRMSLFVSGKDSENNRSLASGGLAITFGMAYRRAGKRRLRSAMKKKMPVIDAVSGKLLAHYRIGRRDGCRGVRPKGQACIFVQWRRRVL